MPKNRQINLIGHSYGGDTAADIAGIIPNKIHTLITIDPVGRSDPDFKQVRKNTKIWINVNAVSSAISGGDIAALAGGMWNDSPEGYADIHIRAPYTHA
jgi:pimeloyl-ACP methyl ester carboxylesterase